MRANGIKRFKAYRLLTNHQV